LIIVGFDVSWILEEERLVESTTSVERKLHEFCIIVPDHGVLDLNGISHNLSICDGSIVITLFEQVNVRLLRDVVPTVVVSGEGVESTKGVPSGAELLVGVTNKTADV
jgi:hypothetical protein